MHYFGLYQIGYLIGYLMRYLIGYSIGYLFQLTTFDIHAH